MITSDLVTKLIEFFFDFVQTLLYFVTCDFFRSAVTTKDPGIELTGQINELTDNA